MPRPTSQDLAGYWDMLQLSVEDVSMKFGELHQLKQNGWKALESPEREVLSPEGPRGPCAAGGGERRATQLLRARAPGSG